MGIMLSPLSPKVDEKMIKSKLNTSSIWLRPGLEDNAGWALVECETSKDAEIAESDCNGVSLQGQRLKVKPLIHRQVCRHSELEGMTKWVVFHQMHRMISIEDLSS